MNETEELLPVLPSRINNMVNDALAWCNNRGIIENYYNFVVALVELGYITEETSRPASVANRKKTGEI